MKKAVVLFFEDFHEGQTFCPLAIAVVSPEGVLEFVRGDPVGGYAKILDGYQGGLASPFGVHDYVPGGLTTVMMTSFILKALDWGSGPVERGGSQTFKRMIPTGAPIACRIDVTDISPRAYPPDGRGKVTFKVTLSVDGHVMAFGTREFLIARG